MAALDAAGADGQDVRDCGTAAREGQDDGQFPVASHFGDIPVVEQESPVLPSGE